MNDRTLQLEEPLFHFITLIPQPRFNQLLVSIGCPL
jgi:hypothetical protein